MTSIFYSVPNDVSLRYVVCFLQILSRSHFEVETMLQKVLLRITMKIMILSMTIVPVFERWYGGIFLCKTASIWFHGDYSGSLMVRGTRRNSQRLPFCSKTKSSPKNRQTSLIKMFYKLSNIHTVKYWHKTSASILNFQEAWITTMTIF